MELILALMSVVFINIILSGDNAVVIALASRNLPPDQRQKAIYLGSGLAVVLRIILVLVGTMLPKIPLIQFIGGAALVYIAYHLLSNND